VTNWAEYNEGLRGRGDLTVWIDNRGHDPASQKRSTEPERGTGSDSARSLYCRHLSPRADGLAEGFRLQSTQPGRTLMSRWKTVIGPKLKARSFKNQKTEAKIGVCILNRMTELGRPNFERTAWIPSRVGRVPRRT
jgi:hypothetical protein